MGMTGRVWSVVSGNLQLPVQVKLYFYMYFIRDTRHRLTVLVLLFSHFGLKGSWREGLEFIVVFCLQYY